MWHAPKERQTVTRGDGETMDWEPTRAAVTTPTNSGQKRRARWVSQEEMDKRRQEGRCFRCGASGHQLAGCEFLPPRRPAEARPAQGPQAAPGKCVLVEPQLESEGSDTEDNSRAGLN